MTPHNKLFKSMQIPSPTLKNKQTKKRISPIIDLEEQQNGSAARQEQIPRMKQRQRCCVPLSIPCLRQRWQASETGALHVAQWYVTVCKCMFPGEYVNSTRACQISAAPTPYHLLPPISLPYSQNAPGKMLYCNEETQNYDDYNTVQCTHVK